MTDDPAIKNILSYEQEYMTDYGFEAHMVHYRHKIVLARLDALRPRTILEIGCGAKLQVEEYQKTGGTWDKWTIVEPSLHFSSVAKQTDAPHVDVLQGFFEVVTEQVPHGPDLILCSGLLHEVPDADLLLASIREKMSPDTTLHLNVPNANSFHRRLAKAMGLISDLKAISERNALLQQPRVYDQASLESQLESHGMQITNFGGYLIKPFTHRQMESLVSTLGTDILEGLQAMGETHPDFASEIFVKVRLE